MTVHIVLIQTHFLLSIIRGNPLSQLLIPIIIITSHARTRIPLISRLILASIYFFSFSRNAWTLYHNPNMENTILENPSAPAYIPLCPCSFTAIYIVPANKSSPAAESPRDHLLCFAKGFRIYDTFLGLSGCPFFLFPNTMLTPYHLHNLIQNIAKNCS